jgi:hypothetical protein
LLPQVKRIAFLVNPSNPNFAVRYTWPTSSGACP